MSTAAAAAVGGDRQPEQPEHRRKDVEHVRVSTRSRPHRPAACEQDARRSVAVLGEELWWRMVGEWPWSEATITTVARRAASRARRASDRTRRAGARSRRRGRRVRARTPKKRSRLNHFQYQVLHGVGFVGVEAEEPRRRPAPRSSRAAPPPARRSPAAVERAAEVAEQFRSGWTNSRGRRTLARRRRRSPLVEAVEARSERISCPAVDRRGAGNE